MQVYNMKLSQQCPICNNNFEAVINKDDNNQESVVAILCPLGHYVINDPGITKIIKESDQQIQWINWNNSSDFDKIKGLRVIEWVVFSIFYISLSMQVSILSLRYSSSRNP